MPHIEGLVLYKTIGKLQKCSVSCESRCLIEFDGQVPPRNCLILLKKNSRNVLNCWMQKKGAGKQNSTGTMEQSKCRGASGAFVFKCREMDQGKTCMLSVEAFAQRILDGEYGAYSLGKTWDEVYDWDNENCLRFFLPRQKDTVIMFTRETCSGGRSRHAPSRITWATQKPGMAIIIANTDWRRVSLPTASLIPLNWAGRWQNSKDIRGLSSKAFIRILESKYARRNDAVWLSWLCGKWSL